ncbi:MAG: hypothetical protein U5Q03_19680 [Bacteroidota bacterium]|nr:hypothetical protein [Bacteroidota bacterium]
MTSATTEAQPSVNRNIEGKDRMGFTFGSYINGRNLVADPYTDDLFRHEYGHVLQSQLMGWGYIPNVAIPGGIRFTLADWNRINHNHDRSWFETKELTKCH